jgi:DNA polymerase elongation subunit (family B)
VDQPKVLLLDIETAPNLVAVYQLKQTYINPQFIMGHGYVLCFTAKWLGKKDIVFAKSPDGHLAMLQSIHKLLSEADAVVHYNGKKFDIPTLNAEFLLHGLKPVKPFVQIDLIMLARRTFNFPSYKLSYVCERLGIGSKTKHAGWDMWKACMDKLHQRYAKAWATMEKYNKQDVILLEHLYKRLRPWFHTTHGFKRIHEYLTGMRSKP